MSFITLVETSLFTSKEFLLTVILAGGTVVIYGKNNIVGLISTFSMSTLLVILFYVLGWNYQIPLKIMMVMFALMTLVLLLVKKQSDSPNVY